MLNSRNIDLILLIGKSSGKMFPSINVLNLI